MSMTDPIADMLTQMRNAELVKREEVEIPASQLKAEIARVLKERNFIKRFETTLRGKKRYLKIVFHREAKGKKAFYHLLRVSRPGRRVYVGYRNIPRPLGRRGVTILSTPKGVLRAEDARKEKVGGEILCHIY